MTLIKEEGKELDTALVRFVRAKAAGEEHGMVQRTATGPELPQPHVHGAQAPKMSGAELQVVAPLINKIENEDDRKQLRGWFNIATKYQVLKMLAEPSCGITQRAPALVSQILDEATKLDRINSPLYSTAQRQAAAARSGR